jgi:hypothetical protein
MLNTRSISSMPGSSLQNSESKRQSSTFLNKYLINILLKIFCIQIPITTNLLKYAAIK